MTLILVIILALLVLNVIFAWLLFSKVNKREDSTGFSMLMQQVTDLSKTVDQKMGETSKQMNEAIRYQFKDSQNLIKEITREITEVKEVGKQTAGFAEQLKSLQDILKNPKQRGVLGEYYLETLLKNALPPGSYQMQYRFPNGEIVDAVVFVKDNIIPIDSKFSLENYNRLVDEKEGPDRDRLEKNFVNDLKMRVEETSKYIRPQDGTMDFAFMFIPHEAIYYDLLVNKIGVDRGKEAESIIEVAARKHKVIIVSPTSFLAYLQTVLQGLKALQIEEKAVDIIKRVEELGRHIGKYDRHMKSLGKSLSTTVNHYTKADTELKKIDKDVYRITGESAGVEILNVEGPDTSID